MKNSACQFGKHDRLVGVLGLPDRDRKTADTAVILVSAGFTAKSGPFRIYAELASRLSEFGMPVLRFDLGGIGMSQTLHPGLPLMVRTKQDIRDAVDYLQDNYDIDEFVIGGLCSGGEDALMYAEDDARVKGIFLIDPHAYRTSSWWLRNVFSRHFINRVIFKLLRVLRIKKIVVDKDHKPSAEGFEGDLIDYPYMKKSEVEPILKKLFERNAHIHYLYTGGRVENFNHRSQLSEMFPDLDIDGNVVVDHIPHIEHLQIFEEDRDELLTTIVQRLKPFYLKSV